LHDAAKYRASLGVVRLLLDAYPEALYVQNQYGNLPLHCATAYQAPSDVVQLLLKVSTLGS
jgi:ankyrin repeat protein